MRVKGQSVQDSRQPRCDAICLSLPRFALRGKASPGLTVELRGLRNHVHRDAFWAEDDREMPKARSRESWTRLWGSHRLGGLLLGRTADFGEYTGITYDAGEPYRPAAKINMRKPQSKAGLGWLRVLWTPR
jgi:hypothetical protein